MGKKQKQHNGLTPINPLDPSEVEIELKQAGFNILQESGIRIFHDFMAKNIQEKLPFETLLMHELNYRHHPDFKRIARYLHWLMIKE